MPIPREPFDIDGMLSRMRACPRRSAEEIQKSQEQAQKDYDEEKKKWLAQFDSNGRLRAEVKWSSSYIPSRDVAFLRKTPEEQATYIVSEKKRLGVL